MGTVLGMQSRHLVSVVLRCQLGNKPRQVPHQLSETNHLHAVTEDQDRPFRTEVRRNWTLGEDVDPQAIGARLEHGVLEITLPKRESTPPVSKTIEIG